MSQSTAAKEIVKIAAKGDVPCMIPYIRPQMSDPSEYLAGLEYAQKMGWVVIVGVGQFALTAAGQAAAIRP